MTGELSLSPKIGTGFDQADTKELLPETVDCDARRQWMSAVYQPVGEIEAIVVAALWFFWKRGKEGGDAAGDLFAGVVIFTAFHDEAISLLREISHYESDCSLLLKGLFLLKNLGPFLLQRFQPGNFSSIDMAEPMMKNTLGFGFRPLVRILAFHGFLELSGKGVISLLFVLRFPRIP